MRFDQSTTKFGGELALTPPPKLIGYSGGELVEIHGILRPELGSPDYPGNWYEIRSIRLWENQTLILALIPQLLMIPPH